MNGMENEKTPVKEIRMEKMDQGENGDAAQRAKFIFLSLAAAVAILLVVSFIYAGKVRSELKAARQEIETLKQDNIKISQWLEERTQETETLKKQVQKLQAQPKIKPKAPAKKKPAAKKSSSSKKSSRTKSR